MDMSEVTEFFSNPWVVGIWGILVVALVDFALGVIQSIRAGAFDLKKLPQILDAVVLRKVIPLAGLGIAAYFVTEPTQQQVLLLAYAGLAATVLAAEVKAILEKVTGAYTPTTLAQDKGLVPIVVPAPVPAPVPDPKNVGMSPK